MTAHPRNRTPRREPFAKADGGRDRRTERRNRIAAKTAWLEG